MSTQDARADSVKPVKLAFLGAGDVAQRDYFPELHRLGDRVARVALCAQSPDRARAMAQEYHFARWYADGDYARMLAENDIDAVANLTPIQLHFETNRALLDAGRHIYSEKPLAGTVAEARQLQQLANERGLTLVSAPCVMLWPQVKYAQALLQQGAIGEVFSARAYGHGGVPPWSGYSSDPTPFFARGGGPGMDMGVYPLHALTGLLGPARRVTAMLSRTQPGFVTTDGPVAGKWVPMEADDNWHMLLDFGNSRIAYVAANNCVQDSRAPQLELHGVKGTIALNLIDVGAPVEVQRAGHGWETVKLPQTGRDAGPDHLLGISHLIDCVQTGQEPVLSAQHALHVLDILETAARSSPKGEPFPSKAGCNAPTAAGQPAAGSLSTPRIAWPPNHGSHQHAPASKGSPGGLRQCCAARHIAPPDPARRASAFEIDRRRGCRPRPCRRHRGTFRHSQLLYLG